MLRPKLWSAAARRRFGLFLPGLICESSCLAAKRFPVRLTAARWAKARAGSIAREPYASPKTLECGGPAPLCPVSPWTHLRIKLSCCEAISRPVDRGKVGQSAVRPAHSKLVGFSQLDPCASRIHAGKRNRQLAGNIDFTEHCARCGLLQTGHVAIRNHVSPELGKTQQEIWISKTDTHYRGLGRDERC